MIGQLVVTIGYALVLSAGTLARRDDPRDMTVGVIRRLARSRDWVRAGDIPNAHLGGLLGEVPWTPPVPRI